jgi:hypothetical protein
MKFAKSTHLPVGTRVEVQWDEAWQPGTVAEFYMHSCFAEARAFPTW